MGNDAQTMTSLQAESEQLKQEVALLRQTMAEVEHQADEYRDRQQGAAQLRFADLFDVGEIQRIQDAFARATGVASVITDPDGNPITRPSRFCDLCQLIRTTERGLANCIYSDKVLGQVNHSGPTIQPCLSGGLLDGGTSITVGEQHIANWLIGQVLDDTCDEAQMLRYARDIGADEGVFQEALHRVPRMSREQFTAVGEMLFLMARQMSQLALRSVEQARAMAERKQAEEERARLQQQVIAAQQAALRELSTPLLPIAAGVIALPIIGAVDSNRTQQIMETLLQAVAAHRATIAIVDITGVGVVDTQVAQSLIKSAQAVKLLGAQVVLTGIQPHMAQTLVHLGIDLSGLITRSTLQAGIAYALNGAAHQRK